MSDRFRFEHSFIDNDPGYDGWGAVAVADFDGDGRPEFATGGKGGGAYYVYDLDSKSGRWSRHVIAKGISPQVGAAASDLDGDGRPEIVCGDWSGRLLWFDGGGTLDEPWTPHVVAEGLSNPHDVLAADLDGDGRDEIVVRNKNGALLLFRVPAEAGSPWKAEMIAERLEGDGTLLLRRGEDGPFDIFTNAGWFENVSGTASRWVRHPLVPDELEWHSETRLAAGDVDGDGRVEIVITESEIARARLALLRPATKGGPWEAETILDAELDLRALHSLEIADLDGDGRLEIFTAEMENGKTDGISSRPRWWCLARDAHSRWSRHVLLDRNLGTHCAAVADFSGEGHPSIVGKVWRANPVNGNSGKNHVDWLRPSRGDSGQSR